MPHGHLLGNPPLKRYNWYVMNTHFSLVGFVILVAAGAVCFLVSCGGGEDLSYTNPEWRSGVLEQVEFPLPERITLRVGVSNSGSVPGPDDARLQWLADRTNIALEFVALTDSPGDVALGEMIRAGTLPDIVPESRFRAVGEDTNHLFVNFLEFPALIPNFIDLAQADERFRNGLLSNTNADGHLISLLSYRPDSLPYAGTIAYRQDVFDDNGLAYETWEDILSSLSFLKEEYPESSPFAGRTDELLYMVPSWFGTGMTKQTLVYYNPDREEWVFGPFEPAYEEYVRFMVELNERGLFAQDAFIVREDITTRYFSNDIAFMAPYRGYTGPYFRFGGEYGDVDENGDWDGNGAWVSSMPLPKNSDGRTGWYDPEFVGPVGSGWMVYNQSDHVAEAIALLDLMYEEQTALIAELGPPGAAWGATEDTGVALLEPYREAYDAGGIGAVRSKLQESGWEGNVPLRGRYWGYYDNLGYPRMPQFSYLLNNDIGLSVPGRTLIAQPPVRNRLSEDTRNELAGMIVNLQSHLESMVSRFIMGSRPPAEYEAFVEELREMGAERLVDAYNEELTTVEVPFGL